MIIGILILAVISYLMGFEDGKISQSIRNQFKNTEYHENNKI